LSLVAKVNDGAVDGVEGFVEVEREVLGEEAEDVVAVLLEERVFAAVAAVCGGVAEVLGAVDLDGEAEGGGVEVDFHFTPVVEGDGELGVELEEASGIREGFKAAEKEGLGCAAGARFVGRRIGGLEEKSGKRDIDTIADEAANAGGVVIFPCGIDGQWDFDGPTGQRAGGEQDGVTDGFVADAAFVEHAGEHRDIEVGIIVDANFFFAVVEAVEAASVLGDDAAPGDGHGKKESVETGIIEAFADEFAGGKNDASFVFGNGLKLIECLLEGFAGHPALEGDQVGDVGAEEFGENLNVFGALSEDER